MVGEQCCTFCNEMARPAETPLGVDVHSEVTFEVMAPYNGAEHFAVKVWNH